MRMGRVMQNSLEAAQWGLEVEMELGSLEWEKLVVPKMKELRVDYWKENRVSFEEALSLRRE
jgi:hypothetical protein